MNLLKQNLSDPNFIDNSLLIINFLDSPERLERELEILSNPFSKLSISIMNINKNRISSLEKLIDEWLIKNILVLIIAEDVSLENWYYKTVSSKSISSSWLIVHPTLTNNLSCKEPLLEHIKDGTTKARFIGHQTHITPIEDLEFVQNHKIESLRLGQIRQNIDRVEPWCRSVEHVIFNTESLRKSDYGVKKSTNMGGFFYEEACKICQFVGASSHLKTIGFFGYDSETDPDLSSVAVLAQMIWYLTDGYYNFREEKQIEKNKLVQYVVNAAHNDLDINFWKNNETGRWWMEVPGHENYWISCTYDDYLEASQGDFSPKLIHALNRI